MNRRDFCLSMGMLVTAGGLGSFAGGRESIRESPPLDFRIKTIPSGFRLDDISLKSIGFLREKLFSIAEEADALLITSTVSASNRFLSLLKNEACRIGLEAFFPSNGISNGLGDAHTALTLTERKGVLVATAASSCNDRLGFYIRDLHHIILFDESRCRWNEFCTVPNTSRFQAEKTSLSEEERRTSRLLTARFLDRVRNDMK